MSAFEAVLLTYHDLYNLRFTILQTGAVYGPWTHHALELQPRNGRTANQTSLDSRWYINDVTEEILWSLKEGPFCSVLDLNSQHLLKNSTRLPTHLGIKKSLAWARAYKQQLQQTRHSKDVIFTSYFTSRDDIQRHQQFSPNHFRYLMNWLVSVRNLGLSVVIFHDELDSAFCHRVQQYHPGLSFVRIPSLLNRTTNDARFYAYLDYLHTHSDLGRVLLTDISDVKFQMNPFQLMQLLGSNNSLFIGTDIDLFPNMASHRWITEHLEDCFGRYALEHRPLKPLLSLDTVYNAGVIGGSRHVILAFLEKLVVYLDATPAAVNCNMPAVNYVVHQYFFHQLFTGFPLTSRFLRFQASPNGVYIIHK